MEHIFLPPLCITETKYKTRPSHGLPAFCVVHRPSGVGQAPMQARPSGGKITRGRQAQDGSSALGATNLGVLSLW